MRIAANHGRSIKPVATVELGLLQLISEGKRWAARCEVLVKSLTRRNRQQSEVRLRAEAIRMLGWVATSFGCRSVHRLRGRKRFGNWGKPRAPSAESRSIPLSEA